MKNYSFGIYRGFNELPTEVLNLFVDLADNPNQQVEFSGEIVEAGLAGKIDFSKPFNIVAYENAIRKNNTLTANTKRKKEVSIDFFSNSESDNVNTYDVISEDTASNQLASKVKDAYAEIFEDDELNFAISTIVGLNDDIMAVEEVDLIRCLKDAVLGIERAVTTIKRISNSYPILAESIQTVLSSGREVEVLFA